MARMHVTARVNEVATPTLVRMWWESPVVPCLWGPCGSFSCNYTHESQAAQRWRKGDLRLHKIWTFAVTLLARAQNRNNPDVLQRVNDWTHHRGPSIPWSSTQPQRRTSHWHPEQPGWSPRNWAKWKGLIPVDYTCVTLFLKHSWNGKCVETDNRLVMAVGQGGNWRWWGHGVQGWLVAAVIGPLCLHVLMSEPWS